MDPLVDLGDVQRLIGIVQRHGLDGLTVAEDDVEVSITADPLPPSAADAAAMAAVEEDRSHLFLLRSPITGVFYRSSSPTEPSFCREGDVVEEHDVVCLVEAMKIFNEITAGVRGKLVRVLADNEQLVVSGEVLMEFEPESGGES